MPTDTTYPSTSDQISPEKMLKALQLGWTFAEVNGRLGQPQMWGGGRSPTRRVFLSHPKPKYGEALWLALQRLIVLADGLFHPGNDTPSVCPVPEALEDFLGEIEEKLAPEGNKSPLSDERIAEVFDILDRWSLKCWVHLGAQSPIMAEAATFGGSLADTYWAMRLPPKKGGEDTRVKAETWRYLIAPNRLHPLIEDVRAIEDYLPNDCGTIFRHTLWEWGIADDLTRDAEGNLQIADTRAWRRLKKRHRREVKSLSPKEEKKIHRNLEIQQRRWKRLVFTGEIPLKPKDRRQIALLTGGVYVLGVALLFTLIMVLLGGLSWFAYGLASSHLFPQIEQPDQADVWLKIGGALVAILTSVGTQLWRWCKSIIGLYDDIHYWWTLVNKKQRSLHRWNEEEKSVLVIAIQHLLFPQAR
jgi:hypothetical protein